MTGGTLKIGRDFRLDVLQKLAGLSEEDLYAALEEYNRRHRRFGGL